MENEKKAWTPKLKDETISILNDGENYFPIQYECISTEKEPVDCGRVESEFKGAMENALKGELEKDTLCKGRL